MYRYKNVCNNKFGAEKTAIDGFTFDSKKEAERYAVLKLLLRAGKIKDLALQQKYVLIPNQRDESGKLIEKECSYIADFVYFDTEKERTVVEDVKGYKKGAAYGVFVIKRKLMLYKYGIKVEEV